MTPYWSDENRGLAIYHGDCREVLPEFADDQFGSVITDPPYGIGFADWDIPPDSAILQECLRVSEGSVVMFGCWREPSFGHFYSLAPKHERLLIWASAIAFAPNVKGLYANWNPIWVWRQPEITDGLVSDVVRHFQSSRRDDSFPRPPTPKPPGLMLDLLRAFGGRSTLDPYMGSGTTLVAAAKLGVPCVGVEISEEYCAMSVTRLAGGFLDSEPPHLFNQEETECTCS